MGDFTQFGKLLAFGSPEDAEKAIREKFEAWACPLCGEEVTALRGKPVMDRRCYGCIRNEVLRPVASLAGRHAALRDCEVPNRFVAPFIATPWPSLPGGASAGDWEGEPWSCGFSGESRSGKTFLAVELLWRLISERSWPALFAAGEELVDSGFSQGSDRELYQRARKIKLLLIDDLGWGGGLEKLSALIRARHAEILPTLWTGNLSRSELAKSVTGQPLAARLWDDGWVFPLARRWTA